MSVAFDFSKLRGRIVERFGSSLALCQSQKIDLTPAALSERLNNHTPFKAPEIIALCAPDVLDIPAAEINDYFFTMEVR